MFRLFTFSWLFILSANNFAGTIHANYKYSKWSSPPVSKGITPKVLPWLEASHRTELDRLYKLTSDAARFGFNEGDFKMPVAPQNMTGTDSVNFNTKTTEIARYFFESLTYGHGKPSFGYDGLNITIRQNDTDTLYHDYFFSHRLSELTDSLNKPFQPFINKLGWYLFISQKQNFKDESVTSKKVDLSNKSLISRLYELGLLTSIDELNIARLKKAIVEGQKSFDLLADGIIRSTFIEQLNIPLRVRMNECRKAINDMRWLLQVAKQEDIILVNIPAAFMQVYHNNTISLSMHMVVGKASTPTPALTSRIQEVILYPYWHVPHSIATKELLPLIKISPLFLDKGGYQVLNRQGKIMDPYRINWGALNPGNFPYLIRQSTGCDNALGLLKLNFYSPYGVYLHDTPSKNAFNMHKRYFSHGCMRMEKPFELGRMILKENSIAIDTLTVKGCLTNQSPVTVKTLHKMALVVWYNPVAISSSGEIIFYEDVYKKFK